MGPVFRDAAGILLPWHFVSALAFPMSPTELNRGFSILWAVVATSTTRLFINLRGMSRREVLEKSEIPILELLSRSHYRGSSVEQSKIQNVAVHVMKETA